MFNLNLHFFRTQRHPTSRDVYQQVAAVVWPPWPYSPCSAASSPRISTGCRCNCSTRRHDARASTNGWNLELQTVVLKAEGLCFFFHLKIGWDMVAFSGQQIECVIFLAFWPWILDLGQHGWIWENSHKQSMAKWGRHHPDFSYHRFCLARPGFTVFDRQKVGCHATCTGNFCEGCWRSNLYPLVNCHITMEKSPFLYNG